MICRLPALEVARVGQSPVFLVLTKRNADSGVEIESIVINQRKRTCITKKLRAIGAQIGLAV